MKAVEITNETFTDILNYDISTVFYLVSYEVMKNKEQEKQIKRLQRKGLK